MLVSVDVSRTLSEFAKTCAIFHSSYPPVDSSCLAAPRLHVALPARGATHTKARPADGCRALALVEDALSGGVPIGGGGDPMLAMGNGKKTRAFPTKIVDVYMLV